MNVSMKNPKTGEIKDIKVGWSWILFLFSGFFGLPLFLRKLYVWGFFFFALLFYELFSGINLSLIFISQIQNLEYFETLSTIANISSFATWLGLLIWFGIKGNEMTAKNYLELGWHFTNPESDEVKIAKAKWGINI